MNRREMLLKTSLTVGAAALLGDKKLYAANTEAIAIEDICVYANGLKFEALAAGPTTGQLVLCLHGFPQFADVWTPLLIALGSLGFRAVAVNQRGYSVGAQPPNITDYTGANLVSDIMGFVSSLGATTFHLVAHDFGAFQAWAVAAQFPKQVLTLTSLSTPHRDAYSAALSSDADQQARSAYIQFFQEQTPIPENALLANNGALLRASYEGENPGGTPPPGGLINVVPASEVNANIARFASGTTLMCALNWYRASDLAAIGPVQVPAMLIWGTLDEAQGRTAAVNTANFCTGIYQFVQLTGRSHWLLEEVPNDVIALVSQHITTNLT